MCHCGLHGGKTATTTDGYILGALRLFAMGWPTAILAANQSKLRGEMRIASARRIERLSRVPRGEINSRRFLKREARRASRRLGKLLTAESYECD